MKKLLFLGGSDIQVPGIKFIKSLGYYVITCDYLPENPGHKISDKYYNVSTTDLDGILEIAKKESEKGAGKGGHISKYINIASQFLRGSRMELKKVKWPTRKELLAATVMVIVLVLVIALFLGLVDFGLIKIIKNIVR